MSAVVHFTLSQANLFVAIAAVTSVLKFGTLRANIEIGFGSATKSLKTL